MIKELYDIQSLGEIDYIAERVIIEPKVIPSKQDAGKSYSSVGFLKTNNEIGKYIESRIPEPVSGEVYLITDDLYTIKFYVLYIKDSGIAWAKVLFIENTNTGKQIGYDLSDQDYSTLKSMPMFASDESDTQLGMFMAAQEYQIGNPEIPGGSPVGPLYYQETKPSSTAAIASMGEFLKDGLWAMFVPANHPETPILNWNWKRNNLNPEKGYYIEKVDESNVLFFDYKVGDLNAVIVGPYETLKKIYITGFNRDLVVFGGSLIAEPKSQIYLEAYKKFISDIENKVDVSPVIVKPETEKEKEETKVQQDDFWAQHEAIIADTKKKSKKNDFRIQSEISENEQQIAAQQTINESREKINTKKRSSNLGSKNQTVNKAIVKVSSTADISIPDDWDDILSIQQTSALYNKTFGKSFINDRWVDDESQTEGMTLEEWNAYFTAHPEYSHLIEPAIGQWGGLNISQEELRKSGALLYNPASLKLEYAHEYLKGNAYMLLEQLEVVKDVVITTYGEDFYNAQVLAIKKVTPLKKSITDPSPEKRPFIHPLDDVVIGVKVTQAAGITFPKALNRRYLAARRKVSKAIKPGQAIQEEDGDTSFQKLSILIFFREWLVNQRGKYREYDVPLPIVEDDMVKLNIVDQMYFNSIGLKRFAEIYVRDYKLAALESQVTSSDYYEMKDNIKQLVNNLFQEFISEHLTQEDRLLLEYEWNKRYNGFITIKVDKYPIFIRHSKYFKDRMKRNLLRMDKSQVDGIKFGTINNGSIIAHEVGYGKSLLSIGYMSHMFETNQANNIMVVVPKSLYSNGKWKEEISGAYDQKRDRYLIGATPQYNIIELGNLTPESIFGREGSSKYKEYSKENIKMILQYKEMVQMLYEAPEKVYNFPSVMSGTKKSWTEVIETAKDMDIGLFNRCIGDVGPYNMTLFDELSKVKFDKDLKKKREQIINLQLVIGRMEWNNTAPKESDSAEDDFMRYLDKVTNSYSFLIKDGKYVWEEYVDDRGISRKKRKRRPEYEIAEIYIGDIIENLSKWVESIVQKMYDYSVFEYGRWTLNMGSKNIFLFTRDAISFMGFSKESREGVKELVGEITQYNDKLLVKSDVLIDLENAEDEQVKLEEAAGDGNEPVEFEEVDITGTENIEVEKGHSRRKSRSRISIQEKMQRQYGQFVSKIEGLMTEEGPRGKLNLEIFNIDGLVIDEAHVAKKLFTSAVSMGKLMVVDQYGKVIAFRTTSHDISGGTPSNIAVRIFGLCQYIRSKGDSKPVMLLTATPFSNQPPEIFSMQALVGIKQMRQQGVLNIKNFFDLFLNETLKYAFDHTGKYIKRITVENFRNKELLVNMIWSVMDIKREASLYDPKKKEQNDMKPRKLTLPKLVSDSSYRISNANADQADAIDNVDSSKYSEIEECAGFDSVSTVVDLDRLGVNSASIVDRNEVQKKMMDDIEKVITNQPNLNNPVLITDGPDKGKVLKDSLGNIQYHSYTFDDVCPTQELFTELENEIESKKESAASRGEITLKKSDLLKDKNSYGKAFKALGLSRALCLSPYLYPCNELPEPTPENVVKYSPKIEYLIKAIKSVKDYHTFTIPKKIELIQKEIDTIEKKEKKTIDDGFRLDELKKQLVGLNAAREVSGQVVYMNILRFNYYDRDKDGKARKREYNLAELIRTHIIETGIFDKDEVVIVSSATKDSAKQDYIKDFQDGKIKLLFGTPAIKEGVDLQNNASCLYVMTPDWNPTDMRQIEGRIWRRGNSNKWVRIIYVLLDQSIEVFIYAKLEEKAKRLQKIMQERNTIIELEEMSLDPKQTQIALASDPQRRADIITKLCGEVLNERKLKVNNLLSELKEIGKNYDLVTYNADEFYNTYMKPFYQEYVEIKRNRLARKKAELILVYNTDKSKFVNNFVARCNTSALTDRILKMGFDLINVGADVESSLFPFTSIQWDDNSVIDLLVGLKTIIENREKFLSISNQTSGTQTYESQKLYDSIVPVRHSTSRMEIDLVNSYLFNRIFEHGLSYVSSGMHSGSTYTRVKLFSGGSVLSMTETAQQLILDTIDRIFKDKITKRHEIGQEFKKLIDPITLSMKDYVMINPFITPANDPEYKKAAESLDQLMNRQITDEAFSLLSINDKIEKITYFHRNEISEALQEWRVMDKTKQAAIVRGDFEEKYGYATIAQIVASLGLTDMTTYNEMLKPITESFSLLWRIKDLMRTKGIDSMEEINSEIDVTEKEFAEINSKIDSLKQSRENLIMKFTKISEGKSHITITDIVESFAAFNTLLEEKL